MLNSLNNLEKTILRTIIYYDLFDYPLTANEIYKGLFKYKANLFSVVNCLEKSENLKKYIETRNGFYFLKTRKEIIDIRKKRRDYSVKKWEKALKAVKIIRFVPFLRAVFLCNSIPYFNAEKDSDIDFFIIIKDKYIWFSRFWITILLHIFKMRRHNKKIKDRICLSFYVTDKSLNLKNFYDQDNTYLYHWIDDLSSIFDDGIYHDFLIANRWIKNYIPNGAIKKIIDNLVVKDNCFSKFFREFQEIVLNNIFGRFLNLMLKKIQLAKISSNKNSRMNEENDCVVVNDCMLKFHEAGLEKINKLLSRMDNFEKNID